MADKGNNRRKQDANDGVSGTNIQRSGGMPLLAAGAATRLANQILSRLQSPFARPGVRAPHPVTLWREITRRLGYSPPSASGEVANSRMLGNAGSTPPNGSAGIRRAASPPQFVWRARPVVQEAPETDPFARRTGARTSASSALRVVGEPQPVTRQVEARVEPQMPKVDRWAEPGALGAVGGRKEAEGGWEGADKPPTFTPAVTVRIEYVPAPVGVPRPPELPALVPITRAAPMAGIERPALEIGTLESAVHRDLQVGNKQPLAPTTDLLSRMVRPAQLELSPSSAPQQEQVGQASPQSIAVQTLPVTPSQSAPQALAMPLAQPQVRPRIEETNQDFVDLTRPAQQRGVVGRVIERIVEILPLPEAVKRLAQQEPRVEQASGGLESTAGVAVTRVEEGEAVTIQPEAVRVEVSPPTTSSHEVVATGSNIVFREIPIAVKDEIADQDSLEERATAPEGRAVSLAVPPVLADQQSRVQVSSPDVVSPREERAVIVSRGPAGLLSSLFSRFGGRGATRTEARGPAPLTLPWVRRNQPVREDVEQVETPSESDVAPVVGVPSQSSEFAVPMPPMLSVVASAPVESVGVVLTEQHSIAKEVHVEQNLEELQTPMEQVGSVEQVASEAGRPIEVPTIPHSIQSANTSLEAASPVDAVAEHTRLEQARPGEAQSPIVGPYEAQTQEVPVWESMPEMAEAVTEAHSPLPEVEARPLASVVGGGLLARILARLGDLRGGRSISRETGRQARSLEMTLRLGGDIASDMVSSGSVELDLPPSVIAPMGGVWRVESRPGLVARSTMPITSGEAIPGQFASPLASGSGRGQFAAAQRRGDIGSRVAAYVGRGPSATQAGSPGARSSEPFAGVLRAPAQMLRLTQLGVAPEEAVGEGGEVEDYIEALNRLYGPQEGSTMLPLAVPYAGFAVPGERASYFGSETPDDGEMDSIPDNGMVEAGEAYSTTSGYTYPLSTEIEWERAPARVDSPGESVGWLTDYSWGEAAESPAAAAEAGMWADVIAASVGGAAVSSASSVALALAGEERSAPDSGEERPPNEERSFGPDMEELADTIYSLIQRRLAIERERNFT